MKKKITVFITVFATLVATLFGFTGCTAKEAISVEPNVINVRIRRSGYGTDYIYALKEQFEKTFADKGYKLNVLTPVQGLTLDVLYQEIYADEGIDVYFSDVNITKAITGQYGQVLADVSDSVYTKPAIKFDGTEEEQPIAQKLSGGDFDYKLDYNGKYYALPFVKDIGALAVNTKMLGEYDLELPRTSKELFNCFSEIMKTALNSMIFPWTYVSGSNNYPSHFTNTWMAQYLGEEDYNTMYSFEKDGAPMTEDGYTVFSKDFAGDAIEKTLTQMYKLFDYNASAFGSATQDLTNAQTKFMKGDAVFYTVGGWLLQEEHERSASRLKDVTFIPIPVISDLGIKVFGAGTDYNFDENKCEEVLSTIIGYADENKTVAEIKPLIDGKFAANFKEDDILRICKARGLTYKRSEGVGVFISEKSTKKEVAAEFLRFCASEDAGKIISEKTMNSSAFAPSANAESEYQFMRAHSKITSNIYFKGFTSTVYGYRSTCGFTTVFPYTGIYVQNHILNDKVTIYNDNNYAVEETDKVYEDAASVLYGKIWDRAQEDWKNWSDKRN